MSQTPNPGSAEPEGSETHFELINLLIDARAFLSYALANGQWPGERTEVEYLVERLHNASVKLCEHNVAAT